MHEKHSKDEIVYLNVMGSKNQKNFTVPKPFSIRRVSLSNLVTVEESLVAQQPLVIFLFTSKTN